MSITYPGYILIPIAVILFLMGNKRKLFYLTVLFSGFTGMSVINFNIVDFSLQPSYLFFLFVLILHIYRLITKKEESYFNFSIKDNLQLFFLLLFAIYSFGTIIFPIFLSPLNIEILNVDGRIDYLDFKLSNITQFSYLIFCVLVVLDMRASKYSIDIVKKMLYLSLLFVLIICIYQIFAFRFDLPFDILFRQNIHGNVQGNRVYGPCIEASMLCLFIVAIVALLFYDKQLSKKIKYPLIICSIAIGAYSRSSSFFVGMILLSLIVILDWLINKRKFGLSIYILIIVVSILSLLALNIPFVKNNMIIPLVEKITKSNESGIERSYYFQKMLIIGIQYPFGIGFGSTRSKDLFSTFASNIGIFGIILCLCFILLNSKLKTSNISIKQFSAASLIIWILMFLSVPEPYFLFIWIIYGVLCNLKLENQYNDLCIEKKECILLETKKI